MTKITTACICLVVAFALTVLSLWAHDILIDKGRALERAAISAEAPEKYRIQIDHGTERTILYGYFPTPERELKEKGRYPK